MNTQPTDLIVELRCADGTVAEFYHARKKRMDEILQRLAAPRLLAQSHLLLASEQSASLIPCRGIDVIHARTAARIPLEFPLAHAAASLDIIEMAEARPGRDNVDVAGRRSRSSSLVSDVEVRTLGGWTIRLRIAVTSRGLPQDERQLFAHLLDLPAIPFRLESGGFGLVNPGNITCLNAWPRPDALPESVLPLELVRQAALRTRTTRSNNTAYTWRT